MTFMKSKEKIVETVEASRHRIYFCGHIYTNKKEKSLRERDGNRMNLVTNIK